MGRTIGSILFFVLAAGICIGQQTPVSGEQRLTDSSGSFSVAMPTGWKGKANADGMGFADQDGKILVAVSRHNYRDFAAFAAHANLERDGLEVVGKPQQITHGQTFRTVKRTQQGTVVFDTSVLFSPYGGGVLIAAIASEADSNAGFDAGLEVAASVRFIKVQNVQGGRQTNTFLSGKHLLYLYTGNGYSERKDIYLCSSGGFYQSTGLGGFTPNDSSGGSFGSQSGRHGTWRVNGSSLILSFNNGSTSEYSITKRQASNEIGLNGRKFFMQNQSVCK